MSLETRLTAAFQAIGADIKALQAVSGGAAGGSPAPYFLATGETYSVANNNQILFSNNIDSEGFLAIDGLLVEV